MKRLLSIVLIVLLASASVFAASWKLGASYVDSETRCQIVDPLLLSTNVGTASDGYFYAYGVGIDAECSLDSGILFAGEFCLKFPTSMAREGYTKKSWEEWRPSAKITDLGFGFRFGIGYELKIGEKFAIDAVLYDEITVYELMANWSEGYELYTYGIDQLGIQAKARYAVADNFDIFAGGSFGLNLSSISRFEESYFNNKFEKSLEGTGNSFTITAGVSYIF